MRVYAHRPSCPDTMCTPSPAHMWFKLLMCVQYRPDVGQLRFCVRQDSQRSPASQHPRGHGQGDLHVRHRAEGRKSRQTSVNPHTRDSQTTSEADTCDCFAQKMGLDKAVEDCKYAMKRYGVTVCAPPPLEDLWECALHCGTPSDSFSSCVRSPTSWSSPRSSRCTWPWRRRRSSRECFVGHGRTHSPCRLQRPKFSMCTPSPLCPSQVQGGRPGGLGCL